MMLAEITIETDVLVIGGGMAGCFAAIKAKEQGVDVVLVNKGYTGKSGQTPYIDSYMVFNPEWGHDLDAWMEQVNRVGEYVNHREWTKISFQDSYARYLDLISWGGEFLKDENGDPVRSAASSGPNETIRMESRTFSAVLRKQTRKSGVEIMDRIMITELIKQDGRVMGAIGFPADNRGLYIFKAKAVIVCAGAGGFKPAGWPISDLTSDGDAMAYRVGARITGKEYPDAHGTSAKDPAHVGKRWERKPGAAVPSWKTLNAEGNEVVDRGTLSLEMEFEIHAGRGPIISEAPGGRFERLGGGSSGMSVHKAEGIWAADTDGSSGIPGLYAAGDSLGNMQVGSVYPGPLGYSSVGCSVTGARAGKAAAGYAKQTEKSEIDQQVLDRLSKVLHAPLERRGGFSPKWVTLLLQNAMIPYYVMYVKHGDRLHATLTLVEFMRDHCVPKLIAKDSHELRLAHETRNMVLNAEMRLRASLFRTESRGNHFREDYPRRDDPNWLAWVLIKEEDGMMRLIKEPIPEEWWPDLSQPYEERYPYRFPGEMEYLNKA